MKNKIALAALAVSFGLFATASAADAQTPMAMPERPLVDLSISYSGLRSNVPVGNCGCFWMGGGSAEIAVPIWRHISAVAELSGEHINNLPGNPGIGLGLISGMGGVRLTHGFHTRWSPFAQGLFGAVHGFDSYFPGNSSPTTYATSFAMAGGLGLDVRLQKHFLIRPIQAEYHYMQLPNNAINPANQQHDIRLSAGIVFRATR
jgi:outer membrane immunogenic protein